MAAFSFPLKAIGSSPAKYVDVTAVRTLSTSIQNTTGRPMHVAVSVTGVAFNSVPFLQIDVSDDNITFFKVAKSFSTFSDADFVSGDAIVPVGKYYRVEATGQVHSWVELK